MLVTKKPHRLRSQKTSSLCSSTNPPPRALLLAASAAALSLHLAALPLSAATTTSWTLDPSAPGDWLTPTSWSAGLPNASKITDISNGGTAQLIPGDASVTIDTLYLGQSLNQSGSLLFGSNSSLTANTAEFIGYSGTGSFNQSGSSLSASNPDSLFLGYNTTGIGAYTLADGQTSSFVEFLGYSGQGTFTQTGGNHIIASSGFLFLGYNPGSSGTYSLSGGQLVAGTELVGQSGAGAFTQTGGLHSALDLLIGPNGSYSLTNGTLQISSGLDNSGSFTLGGTATFSGGGILNLGHATLQDISQVAVNITSANSLLILPAGTHTNAFQSFSNPNGLTAFAGAPITIPLNTTVSGGLGSVDDLLICLGTLTSAASLYGGILVQGPSAVASAGTIRVDNSSSGISDGQLAVQTNEFVGYSGIGTFTQSGGTHTANTLFLGYNTAAHGTYALTNGSLTANSENIGFSGAGTFNQSGGANSPTTLALNPNSSYTQTDGSLAAATLNQSGGNLSLGGPQSLYTIPTITLTAGTTTLTTDAKKVLVTTNLSIASPAQLDLTTNSLILHSANLPADTAALQNDLATHLITSSSLALNSGTALAFMPASDYLAVNGPAATFVGQPVTTSDLLIKYTYLGDANLDGTITATDYAQLDAGFLLHLTPSWITGDFNHDGQINYLDYAAIDAGLSAYQGSNAPLAQKEISQHTAQFGIPYLTALAQDTTPSPVPEPATLPLLALAALPLLRRPRPASQ